MLGVLHMEHHTPIIEETEKKLCFQTIALPIGTTEVLKHLLTISDKHLLHSCTAIVPYFSFTNIPWTPVITTLIHHQSCLLSSRHANHQAILMYSDAKNQQRTFRCCVTIVPLQNQLIVHIFKVEHVVPAINRILIWSTLHIISRNSVYQINKQSISGDDWSSSM